MSGLVGSAAVPVADPEDIRETADEILSRPEYQASEPTLVDRAVNWITEQLGEFLNVAVGSGRGYWVGYAILFLALAGAAYLLWRVFPRGGGLRPRSAPAVVHTSVERLSRDQWLARARGAEEAARWGEAVHARYHALTTGLADRRQLSADASSTSGEHRRDFARSAATDPARVQVFGGATDRFEQVWFGGAPAAPDDSRALAEADHHLLADRP